MHATVRVVAGDPTRQTVDGLIVPISAGSMLLDRIHRQLANAVGEPLFQMPLARLGERVDGDIIILDTPGSHGGGFNTVLFVVDDLNLAFDNIIARALDAADGHLANDAKVQEGATPPRLRSIALSLFQPRRISERGHSYATFRDTIDAFVEVVRGFVNNPPMYIQEIVVVVDGYPDADQVVDILREDFRDMSS
jgi:hypothetical protein